MGQVGLAVPSDVYNNPSEACLSLCYKDLLENQELQEIRFVPATATHHKK